MEELAEQLRDEEQRIFILSVVVVASDKFIKKEYMEQVKRKINMTQIGLIQRGNIKNAI